MRPEHHPDCDAKDGFGSHGQPPTCWKWEAKPHRSDCSVPGEKHWNGGSCPVALEGWPKQVPTVIEAARAVVEEHGAYGHWEKCSDFKMQALHDALERGYLL